MAKLEPSDAKTMTLLDKGQILALCHAKKTIQEIADICTRSVDWVTNIIGALRGSDIETELIQLWEEHNEGMQNKERPSDRKRNRNNSHKVHDGGETERLYSRRVVYGTKRKSNKGHNFGTVTGRLSETGTPRHGNPSTDRSRVLAPTGNQGKNKNIVDKMKQSKDYMEE